MVEEILSVALSSAPTSPFLYPITAKYPVPVGQRIILRGDATLMRMTKPHRPGSYLDSWHGDHDELTPASNRRVGMGRLKFTSACLQLRPCTYTYISPQHLFDPVWELIPPLAANLNCESVCQHENDSGDMYCMCSPHQKRSFPTGSCRVPIRNSPAFHP